MNLTRRKDQSTARLLDLVPEGQRPCTYTGQMNAKTSTRGANRGTGSLPGKLERYRLVCSKTPLACWTPFILPSSPGTPLMRCSAASSKIHWDTADARAIPSTKSGFSYAPRTIGSRSINKIDSQHPSPPMRHTSVSKVLTSAPNKCAKSSIKTHSPKEDSSMPDSSSAYQHVPSTRSPAWAGPYDGGRTHS